MSGQNRQVALIVSVAFLLVFLMLSVYAFSTPENAAAPVAGFLVVFFIILIIAVGAIAAQNRSPRIQRPTSESTAFPPPPPPDTVLVKCQYCGTTQVFRGECSNCGAPLPRPGFDKE